MAESIAQNYFDRYTGADAATVLSALPANDPKTFEDNCLDFKSGKPQPDNLEGIWSKALGAMANAGGGVVVWGIIAKKHGDPAVDAAEKLELVAEVNSFASRLVEISRFATDPPLMGVQVKPIPIAPGDKEGFVVCHIPEGKTKPYQTLKPRKAFFLRMGDESKEPPLSILRQLFNPQLATQAQIYLTYSIVALQDSKVAQFVLRLKNVGTTSIESASIAIDGEGMPVSFQSKTIKGDTCAYPLDPLIHPGMLVYLPPFYTNWERYSQAPIVVNLYQIHQEAKSVRFAFDYTQGRFLYKECFFFKELVLDFA